MQALSPIHYSALNWRYWIEQINLQNQIYKDQVGRQETTLITLTDILFPVQFCPDYVNNVKYFSLKNNLYLHK